MSVQADATAQPWPPASLTRLDEARRADHIYLAQSDRCAYLAQYCAGGGNRGGMCNQLLRNFKCAPSVARRDARRAHYKRQATATLAAWLRAAVPREKAERCTWVPVPPSKQPGDPDFDDRLSRILRLAFSGYDIDVRDLLYQACSTPGDHASRLRLPEQALLETLRFDPAALGSGPIRGIVALFDDVLTSGKHYKCCQKRIREALPHAPVVGVFLMRRAPARAARSLGRAW
jgi:hypothetical protein